MQKGLPRSENKARTGQGFISQSGLQEMPGIEKELA